jgi:putative transposase
MPTHWHFVVHPQRDGQLTAFFRWLSHTHAMRWRVSHHTVGYGHLYQGRFKSFPVQRDGHFLTLCRYVERNALAAGLVQRAQDWPYGSLHARTLQREARPAGPPERGSVPAATAAGVGRADDGDPSAAARALGALLADWPVERPGDWTTRVNRPLSAREVERVRLSLQRSRPLGDEDWTRRTAGRLGLQHTLNPEGRPRKRPARRREPTETN